VGIFLHVAAGQCVEGDGKGGVREEEMWRKLKRIRTLSESKAAGKR
jgi:hypothetical protein